MKLPRPEVEFWEAERLALKPADRLTVSEWAEKNRVLDPKNSAEPGPWKNDRNPLLAGMMDALSDPAVEEVTVMKCVQFGVTEVALNFLGYAIDQAPGPTMLAYPRKEDCVYMSSRRVQAMILETPALRRHLTGFVKDQKNLELAFDSMFVYFAASTSPADVCSKPIRYLICDELDRFSKWSTDEGNPLELAKDRTTTFLGRKILKLSTPTTTEGQINTEFVKSDQRRYWVPCPFCGAYQILQFDQVKVPEGQRDPEAIRVGRLAYYECRHCGGAIPDDGRHKEEMLKRGVWAPDGATVTKAGKVEGGSWSIHAGFHVSALYSPWRSWSEVIGQFFRVKDDPEQLRVFINQWLGEPWKETSIERTEDEARGLCLTYTMGRIPDGGEVLTAGVDVQKDGFYYVVRAWGNDLESWLIEAGALDTWAAVVKYVFLGEFDGKPVALSCLDSGYSAGEAYEMAMAYPDLVSAVKGESRSTGPPYRTSKIERNPSTGAAIQGGILLWLLNVSFFKDRISRMQTAQDDADIPKWHLPADIGEDYLKQITSEKKVLMQNRKTGLKEWRWVLKSASRDNHYWDCEVYAMAAAHMLGLYGPNQPVKAQTPRTAGPVRTHRARKKKSWISAVKRNR